MLLKRIRMASFWGISQVCFELLSLEGRAIELVRWGWSLNWIGDWEIEAGN